MPSSEKALCLKSTGHRDGSMDWQVESFKAMDSVSWKAWCSPQSSLRRLSPSNLPTLPQRRVDPADARAFNLGLKPAGKKCALRVIGAFDKLQREFEREVGKSALKGALEVILRLESLAASSSLQGVKATE